VAGVATGQEERLGKVGQNEQSLSAHCVTFKLCNLEQFFESTG